MHLCAPDRFGGGKKSWQRSVYAACVSRAKGMRKQQKKTAISLHLSDRLHTAAAAAAAPAASAAAAPPASLQVALPCQRRVFAASFHFSLWGSRKNNARFGDAPERKTSRFRRERGEAVTAPERGGEERRRGGGEEEICGTVLDKSVRSSTQTASRGRVTWYPLPANAEDWMIAPRFGRILDETPLPPPPPPPAHLLWSRHPGPPTTDRLHGIRTSGLTSVLWDRIQEGATQSSRQVLLRN